MANCTICRHYGDSTHTDASLEVATLYDELGNKISVSLCRDHSVGLFKMGQRRFLLKHRQILIDLIDSDNKPFLQVLQETVRKNIYSL